MALNISELLAADYHIRQLQARLVDAVWRRDTGAFAHLFAEDAEWLIAGQHARGRADIERLFAKLIAPSARVLMLAGQPVLDIGADAATGRSYITEYVKYPDGSTMRTIGIYYDRYVPGNDRWHYQRRQWQLCYRGPVDCSGPFQDVPDYGPPPALPPLA